MSTVFHDVSLFLLYAVLAVFAQNAIFTRSLGVSRMIALVEEPSLNSVLFGGLLVAVQLIAAPFGWAYATYLAPLIPASMPIRAAVRPLAYILCSFLAMGIVWLVLEHGIHSPRCSELKMLLPLATLNCCVLGTLLISGSQHYTLAQSLGFGLGSAVGYLFAVLLVTEAQRRLRTDAIPPMFRGLPITLIYTGILALAIYSVTGHMLNV